MMSEITETSGRGVGVAALREACTSIGGVIEIDSAPGHGTTFRFKFDLAQLRHRLPTQ